MLPIVARWTGEEFTPLGRSRKDCDAELVVGQIYKLERVEERSEASHRHYFAAVAEVWSNLPEDLSERFPNSKIFRKFCLIKTGYCTQQQHVAKTRAEAERLRAFMSSVLIGDDHYAIITLEGTVVTVWKAESQSYKEMGKKRFTESKQAVLDYCASLVGVAKTELERNAGMAA